MSLLEPPLMSTSIDDCLDGLAIAVRGELSTRTAPALDQLLDTLVRSSETLISIDLRAARVLTPAGERLLARWGAVADTVPGTYRFAAVSGPRESPAHGSAW